MVSMHNLLLWHFLSNLLLMANTCSKTTLYCKWSLKQLYTCTVESVNFTNPQALVVPLLCLCITTLGLQIYKIHRLHGTCVQLLYVCKIHCFIVSEFFYISTSFLNSKVFLFIKCTNITTTYICEFSKLTLTFTRYISLLTAI